jgi:hypothetical protein
MCSLLLKKALPFALTLLLGSFIGGLFKSVGFGGQRTERSRAYFYGYGEGRSGCKHARGRYLVAESKPLTILFKPDALLPAEWSGPVLSIHGWTVQANVTFGADGKVREVTPASDTVWGGDAPTDEAAVTRNNTSKLEWDAVAHAARQIQFEPEIVNGLPVTVTREVKIHVALN